MTLYTLDTLLAGLFDWLNKNKPIKKDKPLCAEDVAHISLSQAEFDALPGEAEYCTWRRAHIKRYQGLQFWLSSYALPAMSNASDLSRRVAWKLTGNTMALFKSGDEK